MIEYPVNSSPSSFQNAILKGVDYLYENQLPYGEFKTYVSPDKSMCMQDTIRYVSTTYITTFVLYSLSFVEHKLIEEITRKSAAFLLEEMESPGVWRFFTVNRSVKFSGGRLYKCSEIGVVPDLDDTACISFSLKQNKISFRDNLEIFLKNRDEQGLFYTWLMDFPKRKDYEDKLFYYTPVKNDICCGVNANILLYLGENESTLCVCEYLNDVVLQNKEENSLVHFPDTIIFYYLLSRAYYCNIHLLEKSKDTVLDRILSMRKKDGSFGSILSTAMAVCSLINYNRHDESLAHAVNDIVQSQNKDGSWQKERFCVGRKLYYGSEELTTSICLEALARYSKLLNSDL